MTVPMMTVEKVTCTAEEYRGALHEAGGVERLTVLSCYTYIDDPGTTPMGPGRHVYTEWGTKAGEFIAEHEEHNGEHTYRIPLEGSGAQRTTQATSRKDGNG